MAIELAVPKKSPPPVSLYVVGGVALVLAAAVFVYLQFFSPKPAADIPLTDDAKAYIRNLNLSDVDIKSTTSYLGQRIVEIDGKIANVGSRNLDEVDLYCIFYDHYGQLVLRKRVAIVSPRAGGLPAGEMKSFHLPFDEIPDSWNQTMPQLVIAGVKFL